MVLCLNEYYNFNNLNKYVNNVYTYLFFINKIQQLMFMVQIHLLYFKLTKLIHNVAYFYINYNSSSFSNTSSCPVISALHFYSKVKLCVCVGEREIEREREREKEREREREKERE